MSDEQPLKPTEFVAAVRVYANDNIENETTLKRVYASQLSHACSDSERDPLEPQVLSGIAFACAGVDVDLTGRDRLELVYREQIQIASE